MSGHGPFAHEKQQKRHIARVGSRRRRACFSFFHFSVPFRCAPTPHGPRTPRRPSPRGSGSAPLGGAHAAVGCERRNRFVRWRLRRAPRFDLPRIAVRYRGPRQLLRRVNPHVSGCFPPLNAVAGKGSTMLAGSFPRSRPCSAKPPLTSPRSPTSPSRTERRSGRPAPRAGQQGEQAPHRRLTQPRRPAPPGRLRPHRGPRRVADLRPPLPLQSLHGPPSTPGAPYNPPPRSSRRSPPPSPPRDS